MFKVPKLKGLGGKILLTKIQHSIKKEGFPLPFMNFYQMHSVHLPFFLKGREGIAKKDFGKKGGIKHFRHRWPQGRDELEKARLLDFFT